MWQKFAISLLIEIGQRLAKALFDYWEKIRKAKNTSNQLEDTRNDPNRQNAASRVDSIING